ncbi:MAG TPA: septum formation initiator family protein [Clostridia bacterium]|nr:septum formation initiator family protein [Clostridia bacterium]
MSTTAKNRKFSFILTFASIALVSFLVISFANLRREIQTEQIKLDMLLVQCEKQEEENLMLEQMLEEGSEAEYIERIARDELGYVMPGERVYIDISSGK